MPGMNILEIDSIPVCYASAATAGEPAEAAGGAVAKWPQGKRAWMARRKSFIAFVIAGFGAFAAGTWSAE
jgi:hypothetical protein